MISPFPAILLKCWTCFFLSPLHKNSKGSGTLITSPPPQRINGTHYFYSYHKSGCADMDWDSDLFYIHNGNYWTKNYKRFI